MWARTGKQRRLADSKHANAVRRRRTLFSLTITVVVIAGFLLAAGSSAGATTTVLSQGFESGLGGWTASGFWHVQSNPQTISVLSPNINPNLVTLPDSGQLPSAYQGSNVAWFGEASTGTYCGADSLSGYQPSKDGCTSYTYDSSTESYVPTSETGDLISPSFSLAGVSAPTLKFASWWEIEAVDPAAYDIMEVDYSTDGGGTWTSLGTLNPASGTSTGTADQDYTDNGLETPATWKLYSFDLSKLAGQPSVMLRFHFDTVDASYNGFRGWLLDNITVTGAGSGSGGFPQPTTTTPPPTTTTPTSPTSPPTTTPSPPITTTTTPSVTQPAITAGAPSVQSSTGAMFLGTVNPEGAQTTAYFQYGLDPSYTNGGSTSSARAHAADSVTYTGQVTAQPYPVGSDFTNHTVTATASDLVPNALYHVRLVAVSSAGTAYGPDQTFTTKQGPAPGAPVLGQSFNAVPVSGHVYVRLPGSSGALSAHATTVGPGFVPLTKVRQLPMGTQVDTRSGTIRLINATGKKNKLQNATFNGAIFKVTQSSTGANKGLTSVKLLYGAFPGAPSYASCKATTAQVGSALAQIAVSGGVLSTLNSRSHGRYSSGGHYGSATSRGTAWTITDRCNSTLITVQKDVVAVRDFVHHKTIILHAGQHYLITAK